MVMWSSGLRCVMAKHAHVRDLEASGPPDSAQPEPPHNCGYVELMHSRKNWLFAGSMEGAHRAAVLYSLVQSCQLVGIDPFVCFRDVLLRVATHPHSRIAELTPAGWARIFGPDSVQSAS